MNFHLIDIEQWERKPYFQHYSHSVKCTYSITANIEITELLHEIRRKNLKLYPVLLYILTTVVNKHQEFRTCFDQNGKLGYWDTMNPSYTIFHKENESFSSIWTTYHKDFSSFYANYLDDIKHYGDIMEFQSKPNTPNNTFPVSSIPWVSFTGFNLNIYNDAEFLLPIFTLGKYFEQNGKVLIPLSIQVHHAVCDGYHVSRYINEVQELAVNFETWL
mgnify:CR=1 FL=1